MQPLQKQLNEETWSLNQGGYMKTQITLNKQEVRSVVEENSGSAYQCAIDQLEKTLISETLIVARGNQTKAAIILGLNRGTLRKKLAKHDLF